MHIVNFKATGNSREWLQERKISLRILSQLFTTVLNLQRRAIKMHYHDITINIINDRYSCYAWSEDIDITSNVWKNAQHKTGLYRFIENLLHEFWHYVQAQIDKVHEDMFEFEGHATYKKYRNCPGEKQAFEFEKMAKSIKCLYCDTTKLKMSCKKLKYTK